MRAALINLGGLPRDGARSAAPLIAGKTIARRQLEFALAAGCDSVIALGDGASAEAIALRHAAEAAGVRFQAVRDAHGLLGTVRAGDEVLALAPGLLPEAAAALDPLSKGKGVLVFPAAVAVAAGFERIDRDRAWAGAMVVGGAQVERLSDLPADVEPASALVRIALQASLPERGLSEQVLAHGSWTMPGEGQAVKSYEQRWLQRHFASANRWSISEWLADRALRPAAVRLLDAKHSIEALASGAVALVAASILLAGYGLASLGLGLLVPAAGLAHAAGRVCALRAAPFGRLGRWANFQAALPALVDLALVACVALAIEGSWLHRLFPPLVLFGARLTLREAGGQDWRLLAGDRGLLAIVLAIAAAFGVAEAATMIIALGMIAASARITRV